MIRKFLQALPEWLRKSLTAIILITLIVLAYGTDTLGAQIHQFTIAALREHTTGLAQLAVTVTSMFAAGFLGKLVLGMGKNSSGPVR